MARRVITSSESKSKLPFMYQVDSVVGRDRRGDANKRISDIQLVKLFLRTFFSLNPGLFKKLPQPRGGKVQGIPLDSNVDGQTIAGITVFQQDSIRIGASATIVDGRVSVPTGFRVTGSIHVFTIFQLNSFFFNSNELNRSFNANLEDHPSVKGPLQELNAELTLQRVLRDLQN